MGQILRRQIPVVNGLEGLLAGKVEIQDVVDTLLSNIANVPLSAKQGNALELKKIEVLDIVDTVLSSSSTSPLSANMGTYLAGLFNAQIGATDVVDDLVTADPTAALSAMQGKVLHDLVIGRQDGMTYGGTLDLSTAPYLPRVDEAGTIYVISGAGNLNSLEAQVGDMIVSNGPTHTLLKGNVVSLVSAWDIIDSSEKPDVLRVGNKQISIGELTKVATGGITKDLIDAMLQEIEDSRKYLVVDKDATIVANKFMLERLPMDDVIISDMVYVTNADGTYDEWEGVTVDGNEVTLLGAGGQYDGLKVKVSYFAGEAIIALSPLMSLDSILRQGLNVRFMLSSAVANQGWTYEISRNGTPVDYSSETLPGVQNAFYPTINFGFWGSDLDVIITSQGRTTPYVINVLSETVVAGETTMTP